MKSIKRALLKQDSFGHSVQLNFNQRGQTVNTYCGACVSILLYAFMLYFLAIKTKLMLEHGDNNIQVSTGPIDFDEMGDVDVSKEDFGFQPFA